MRSVPQATTWAALSEPVEKSPFLSPSGCPTRVPCAGNREQRQVMLSDRAPCHLFKAPGTAARNQPADVICGRGQRVATDTAAPQGGTGEWAVAHTGTRV